MDLPARHAIIDHQLLTRLTLSADAQVGIVGLPPRWLIGRLNHLQATIHDLDALLVKTDLEEATAYLPKVYCAILRTVVLNAISLKLEAIFIDVGRGKCDSAYHVATVLAQQLAIPVIRTSNDDTEGCGYPISRCRLPLIDKLLRITEGVKRATPPATGPPPCAPVAGFWGVPPRDFSILTPFPDATHVYGWSRCMENKTPADSALEEHYNPAIPTVFFAQSFCAKTALAFHLANRHPCSLFLDVDVTPGSSARAKVQAFLELSGAYQ